MGADSFAVDLDELDAVVADVAACERALEALTVDVEQQVAALHQAWDGLAADAQRAAHQEWERGLRAMRAALADLRAAARTAHDGYRAAAGANAAHWSTVA